MSRDAGTQTQTQTATPPSYLMPHMQNGADAAASMYNAGGPPVIPFAQQTQQALDLTQQRALAGSPVNTAAQSYATNVLGGGMMGQGPSAVNPFATNGGNNFSATNPFAQNGGTNPYASQLSGFASGQNPHLDAMFNQAARATQNQLTSEFALGGRNLDAREPIRADQLNNLATSIYGSAYDADRNRSLSAAQGMAGLGEAALGRQFSGTEANLGRGFGAMEANLGRQFAAQEGNIDRAQMGYESERQRQQSLVPFASGLANQDYVDYGNLAGVGAQYEGLQREYANQPSANLDAYLSRILGFPGGTSTSSVPLERNWLAGALGGGMLGAQAFPGNPWGMLGGAALGGLV